MKKIILGYFFVVCLFSSIGFSKSLSEAKIGFKGVYLEQDSNEACKIIKEKFSDEKYKFSKKDYIFPISFLAFYIIINLI